MKSALEAIINIKDVSWDYSYLGTLLSPLATQLHESQNLSLSQKILDAIKDVNKSSVPSDIRYWIDYENIPLSRLLNKLPHSEAKIQLFEEAIYRVKKISKSTKETLSLRLRALVAILRQMSSCNISSSQLLQDALEIIEKVSDNSISPHPLEALAILVNLLPSQGDQTTLIQDTLKLSRRFSGGKWGKNRKVTQIEILCKLAKKLPTEERKALLKEALDFTRKLDPQTSVRMLNDLAEEFSSEEERQSILHEALDGFKKWGTYSNYDQKYRLGLKAMVAVKLPAQERKSILQEILDEAKGIYDGPFTSDRDETLKAVLTKIPNSEAEILKDVLQDIYADKLKFRHQEEYSEVVKIIATQLSVVSVNFLNIFLDIARRFDFAPYRLRVFKALAAHLPKKERLSVLEEALEIATSIHEYDRAEALISLVSLLPEKNTQLLREITLASLSGGDKERKTKALASFAFTCCEPIISLCSNSHMSTLLEIVPKGKNSIDKAKFLSALAPRLTSYPGLFHRALEIIKNEITHPAYQAESLGNLAPYLTAEQLSEALDVATIIPGLSYPATALCNLIPYLSLHDLEKALNFVNSGQQAESHDNENTSATSQFIPRISPPELLASIFLAAAKRLSSNNVIQIQPDNPTLKKRLIQCLLDNLSFLDTDKSIAIILNALIPIIDSDEQIQQIKTTLSQNLVSEYYQSRVLAVTATLPNLAPSFYSLIETLQRDHSRAFALSAFIATYPDLYQTVVNLRDNAPNSVRKADLALILATRPHATYLSTEALRQLEIDQANALKSIRGLYRDPDKARFLIELAPHLCSNQLLEAQSIAQDIQNRYHQARSLLALATYFPEVRAAARTQIASLQDQDPIHYIELLSQYTITVPEQIPTLLKAIEDWAENNPFKDDPNEPDPNIFKRRRILIALKPHLPIRLDREIDRETGICRAPQDLWQRALFVLRTEYRQALKTGSLRNDATQDEDLLNLKDEINALTEMLLMRDLEPPVAVGILGGWGGGKTYIMHLMQTHMVQIRSQGLEPIEAWGLTEGRTTPDSDQVGRFVGHIYQIKFDAWTYAKGDLWASLMQTIFFELNRQISLEQKLKNALEKTKSGTVQDDLESLESKSQDVKDISVKKLLSSLFKRAKKLLLSVFQRKKNNQKDSKVPQTSDNPPNVLLAAQSGEIWKALYETNDEDRNWILENALTQESLTQWKKETSTQSDSDQLWELFATKQSEALDNLKIVEERLDSYKSSLNQKRAKILQNQTKYTILRATSQTTLSLLNNRLGDHFVKKLQNETIKQLQKVPKDSSEVLDQSINWIDLVHSDIERVFEKQEAQIDWQFIRNFICKNILLILFCFSLILLAIFFPQVLEILKPSLPSYYTQWLTDSITQTIVRITPLLSILPIAQGLLKKGQTLYEEVRLGIAEYKQQLEKGIQRQLDTDREFRQLNRQVQLLEKEVEARYAAIPVNIYSSIAEFVNHRLEEGGYQDHLGLMHQVKEDLAMLSKRLLPPPVYSKEYTTKIQQLKEVFPRGPARVVLYIDDLDRCPPNTVVEVLEAVQLLVKNPLFIAVLAIDERYINRALAQHYKGVLSLQGRPSAADYLEKIIQIPYRIRPIAEDALRSYLRAQVVVQDSETSGTKFNEFSPQEFNLLIQCCQEAELSPRSLKRLTNVYKLYKILSRTRGHRPTRREQKAILTLLAFSSRYPDLMRDIIEEIGSHYEEGRHLTEQNGRTETLANIIHTYLDKYERLNPDSILLQDVKKLRHDVKKLVEDDLELKEIRQIFDFVRSFSFVGDIGTDYTPSSTLSQTSVNLREGG